MSTMPRGVPSTLHLFIKLFGRNIFVYILRTYQCIEQKVSKSYDDNPIATDITNLVGNYTL